MIAYNEQDFNESVSNILKSNNNFTASDFEIKEIQEVELLMIPVPSEYNIQNLKLNCHKAQENLEYLCITDALVENKVSCNSGKEILCIYSKFTYFFIYKTKTLFIFKN